MYTYIEGVILYLIISTSMYAIYYIAYMDVDIIITLEYC